MIFFLPQDSLISTTSRVLPNGAVELINTPTFNNNLRLLPGHVAQSRIASAVSPLSIVTPQQVTFRICVYIAI